MVTIRNLPQVLAIGLVCLFALAACEESNALENKMITDVKTLERFIKLPIEPEKTRFSVVAFSENDNQLFAELTYSTDDYQQLIAKLTPGGGGEPKLIHVPEWFDTASLPSDITQEDSQFQIPADHLREASAFFNSPYLDGFAILSKTENTVLVILFTS